jgi:hypothetical protein
MKIWLLLAIAGLLLVWSLSREGFEGDTPAPTCTDSGATLREDKSSCDFPTVDPECVPGTEWKPGYCTRTCPPGTTSTSAVDPPRECSKKSTPPVCPAGFTYEMEREGISQKGKCKPAPATAATAATGATGGTTTGTTAGGTTGGSSTSSAAPNAGPVGSSGKGKSIYGPVYTSLGTPASGGGGGKDSSTTNQYPELLGGLGDDTSKRWQLSQSGALPSTASLGSDANAAYFPNSRSPGDQDLIPDPYRLSRNYSTASYSNKTDPVPFLTDFSAFFK